MTRAGDVDDIEAAPGVLLIETKPDYLKVLSARSDGETPSTAQAASVNDLIAQGLVYVRRRARFTPDMTYDWNCGWPDIARDCLLLTPERALYLPLTVSGVARRLLVARFIASCPADIAEGLVAVLSGSATIRDVRPLAQVERALEVVRDGEPQAQLVTARSEGWLDVDEQAVAGPLSAAQACRAQRLGSQWVASARVLPSIGSLSTTPMTATGVREDADDARLVAGAEAVERHVAALVPRNSLINARLDELPEAVDPHRVISFQDWQIRARGDLVPFDPAAERLWVQAVASVSGHPSQLLADLVFYPFAPQGRSRHFGATSSGVAAHTTEAAAILGAWGELNERHEFMRHWLGRKSGRRVTASQLRPDCAKLREDLRADGWTVDLIQLGDRAVFCAVAQKRGMVALGAGAGSPERALASALREAWAGALLPNAREEVPDVTDVRGPGDHRRLWRWGNYASQLDFLCEPDESVELSEVEPLPGPSPTSAHFTWPAAFSRPFIVSRVVDPSLIPITFGYQAEPLGRPDVGALVRASGRDDRGLFPHPFP